MSTVIEQTTVTFKVETDTIENVIDQAGYIIGYWASEGAYDRIGKTYTVWETEAHDTDETDRKFVLTYHDIVRALIKVANRQVKVNRSISDACADLLYGGEGDLFDADCADVIIQVACFGEIVYG